VPEEKRGQEGFTLLEMIVAVLILAVAFTALAGVLTSGIRTADASTHRAEGFTIATRVIEGMHAVPYSLLGFYADQSPAAWGTNTTVILGSCSTACGITPLLKPAGTDTEAGITYTVQRYIYWEGATAVSPPAASAPATTTDSQAYKGVTVTVTWTDRVGSHTVEQDSIIYPGGLGTYTGPGGQATTTTSTTAATLPGAPGTPTLWPTQPAASSASDGQEIDVSVPPTGSGGTPQAYYLQYSTDPTFTTGVGQVDYPVTPNTQIQVQGLAASTTYYFRAYATNAAGTGPYSSSLSATTPAPATTTTTTSATTSTTTGGTTTTSTTSTTLPCSVGSFTISTNTSGKTYLHKKTGALTENIGLSVNVTGSCSASVTVGSVGTNGATDPGSPYPLSGPSSGGQWAGTIFSSTWPAPTVGTHTMTVYVNGSAIALSHGLLVCAYIPPGQRSSSPTSC
jgi:prepilin-type N-terminal cleavage/methylation domain-containing protein